MDIALDEVCAMSWRSSGRQSLRPKHHVMAHTSGQRLIVLANVWRMGTRSRTTFRVLS